MDKQLQWILLPMGIATASAIVLILARSICFRLFTKWTRNINQRLDVIGVIRTPSLAWCLAIGLYLGIATSDMPQPLANQLIRCVYVILILSATLAISNITGVAFRHLVHTSDGGPATSGLATVMVKGTINIVGMLVIFSVMGISIAPLLTALGVGGLAVALAFKDTLENLFAGIYLITDRTIRVGDFIKLVDSNQEGYVEDIGWRTTRIALLNHNTVIIPNSKLAQCVVVNYSLPDRHLWTSVSIKLPLDTDINKVEEMLGKIARNAAHEVPGMVSTPGPSVRLNFGEGTLDFSVSVYVKQYTDQYLVQHELRKRIIQEIRALGITAPAAAFPFSIRAA